MVLFNGCKINLGLDVISRREDGFHEIATLMYPVSSLADSVEIVHSDTFRFTSSGLAVDCPDESNIVLRAARLLKIDKIHIHLHKAIPFGAGLGGGSSDGAVTLLILNKLYNLNLSNAELETIAAELGSDVPFFVNNVPALCTGRGEIMTPLPISLSDYGIIIIKPPISVSTAEAYADIVPQFPFKPLSERILQPITEWRNVVTNAFEKSLFVHYPRLAQIKQTLYDTGAIYASMSGSGSAIFGIFEKATFNEAVQALSFGDCFVHSAPLGQ